VTRDELQAFIGILFVFGINSMPNIDDYWQKSDLFGKKGIK
jgi:hypothetical protein